MGQIVAIYEDKELVIVDNGTEPLFIPEHPSIHYFRQDGPRLPHGKILNLCCEKATGEILINWDDDDWSSPDRMKHTVRLLLSDPAKQVAGYHDVLYYDDETHGTFHYRYRPNHNPPLPSEPQSLDTYASGNSQCYTKAFWETHKFREIPCGADGVFSKQAQEEGKLITTDSVGHLVAITHGDSASRSRRYMGKRQFPAVPRDTLPMAFREELEKGDEQCSQPENQERQKPMIMNPNETLNYKFQKVRAHAPRVMQANLDAIDAALANIEVHPYARSRKTGKLTAVKTLEVGDGLILDDDGEGNFTISLATKEDAAAHDI